MTQERPRGAATVLAALDGEWSGTSALYDAIGYPALMRAGLISYEAFRATLVALVAQGAAERTEGEDGTTLWRRR